MKYTTEVTINLPRERVIELFDNPDNMSKWQPDLLSFKHVSGEAGHPGAKSQLKYKMGSREFDMIETITARNLPDEFSGTYETDGVWNQVVNRFYDEGDKTRWVAEHEFKFSGLMMRLMGLVMPGAFKKQTRQTMQQFKEYAESA